MAMARLLENGDKSGAMQRSHYYPYSEFWWAVARQWPVRHMVGGWWGAVGDGVFVYQQRRQSGSQQCVMDARAVQCRQHARGSMTTYGRACREGPVWRLIRKIVARTRTHSHYRSPFLMRRVVTLRANLTKRSSIVRYPPSLTLSASFSSDFLSANHMYFKRFLHCSIVKMCSFQIHFFVLRL